MATPPSGPYDVRYGYTLGTHFHDSLITNGFRQVEQAQSKNPEIAGLKLPPMYEEKANAGLDIVDSTGQTVHSVRFPRRVYPDFESIPPLLVKSLLFVENRELLKPHWPRRNPAIEWDRFANAILGQGLKIVGFDGDGSGGSTLATQLEKLRHSKNGITNSPQDKISQMLAASLRAYQNGPVTTGAPARIIYDYINSLPLAAHPKLGEVVGFADGMALWFGTDFDEANVILNQPQENMNDDELRQVAKIYRQALALVMAVKEPTIFLLKNRNNLEQRIDDFLPLLAEEGIISPRFAGLVGAEKLVFADTGIDIVHPPSLLKKTIDSHRLELLNALRVGSLYDLDRYDIETTSTIDGSVSEAVQQVLNELSDPVKAKEHGIIGYQLLRPEAVGKITFMISLYEKSGDRNLLRVQTDNFNGPLNLNKGTKLELGSTAKLRTLTTYLEMVAQIHGEFRNVDTETLQNIVVAPQDNITEWAIRYLTDPATDKSLKSILEAALERPYSGSPREWFFTAGGRHSFVNFEPEENYKTYSVKDALHHSVNLSFIRIMRDIVNHTIYHKMNVDPSIFTNTEDILRKKYLEQFVHVEGTTFLWKFWKRQEGKNAAEIANELATRRPRSAVHLAVIFRTLFPEADLTEMETFVRKHCASCTDNTDYFELYEKYGPGKFILNDLGYITSLNPLELWLATRHVRSPDLTWSQAVEESSNVRLETYKWLFKPHKIKAQNKRIQIMLEQDAFKLIHKEWAETGYPFSTLIPSYATSIGVSGDTPAALSELAGIIQNNGLRKPAVRFSEIRTAGDTPYERRYEIAPQAPERVLPKAVARLLHREMEGVVEKGTGRRIFNRVTLSDGTILPVGGKTGTGDNRVKDVAKSRTGTFVFNIDDRFFGTITAYVEKDAQKYRFTSGLAVQVLRTLVPSLRPLFDRSYAANPKPVVNQCVIPEDWDDEDNELQIEVEINQCVEPPRRPAPYTWS